MMFKNDAAEFVYYRTYAKWDEQLKRRQTWEETVDRVINFLKDERGDKVPPKVFKKIKQSMLDFSVLPSMRLVWSAGPAAKASNVCIYNCSFLPVDSIESFAECLYILCCGSGVGFSVERKYTQQLPIIKPIDRTHTPRTCFVGDSKEAWADSVKMLLENLYEGKNLEFDYSNIRPKGTPLKTMGGRASGPEPLAVLHASIKQIFNNAQGRKLTSLECHDIMNKIAEIVVSGGVRRSSEISLSDLDDEEMQNAKVWPFPLHRAMANNSAVYYEKPSAVDFLKEWSSLASSGTGERGISNLGATRALAPKRRNGNRLDGFNPCQPGFAKITTRLGNATLNDIDVGSEILTKEGFAEVIKKWSTGVQPVYEYKTAFGSFVGTKNHKVETETQLGRVLEEVQYCDYLISNEDLIAPVISETYLGDFEVFDITVDNESHTYFTDNISVSNCHEIALRSYEFCNLSTIIVTPEDDLESLLEKVETATWIGIIQATFTDFPYLRPTWKQNCDEERLLGISLSGQMDNTEVLTSDALKAMKQKALKVAKRASEKLNINMPAAITCGKPEGNTSQLVSSGSGAHPWYSPYFIRRYRIAGTDPLFKMMRDQGFKFTPENGQTEDNATTWVVSFPVKAPEGAIFRNDLTAIQQLEWYKKVQTNWCEHNQSITVYVKDHEWFDVGNWVYNNWDICVGVSFLPYDGGKYEQAPYEEITEEKYNKLSKNFPKINYSKLSEYEQEDLTEGAKTFACVGDKCELK